MKTLHLAIIATAIIIPLVIAGIVIGTYNGLVSADANVKAEFSEVRNQYQRQADLIPNLVNATKLYMNYEGSILQNITEARTAWAQASTSGNEEAQDAAGAKMSGLLAMLTVENYPELKSSTIVLSLMDELAGTQNRITVARGRYIEAVNSYNKIVRSFPSNVIAGMFGFSAKEYYQGTASESPPPVNI